MIDLRRADLHMHTHCSDGQLAPAALVAKARTVGLHALAVTDHDSVEGLAEAMEAGRQHRVEIIGGVELSVTVEATEVHLLGYFFDPTYDGLRAHLAAFQAARRHRAEVMVERLNALGIPLRFEAVDALAQGRALGRPHVAQALVAAGFVETYIDAFAQYIGDGGPASVAKPAFPAREALALLHEAGGIGVLAHPGHWTSDRVTMALIRDGLDGIETIHPAHDAMLTRYYRQIVRDFALVETGGSDYHGFRPDDEARLTQFSIPYPTLERARRAARTRTIPVT